MNESESTYDATRPDSPRDESSANPSESDTSFVSRRDQVNDTTADSQPDSRPQFDPGDLIAGRFEIRRVIGHGGMGEVYEVFDVDAQEHRALKVMLPSISGSHMARERFRNESKVRRLRHPHIVETIDIGEAKAEGLLYISMELVDGVSLRQHIRTGRVTTTQALTICHQLCQALNHAHSNGVIHRDVKPENVLIAVSGGGDVHIWLTDFGIAQLQSHQVTSTNVGIGTYQYAAPEQQESASEITNKADLYSVGVLCYELLTGRVPRGVFADVAEHAPDVPYGVDALIREAMAQNPEQRPVDAAMMAARFGKLLKDKGHEVKLSLDKAADLQSVQFGDFTVQILPSRAPEVAIPGAPPVNTETLDLEGRAHELKQNIELIESRTHPQLANQIAALDALQERVNQLKSECDAERPASLSTKADERLQHMIANKALSPSALHELGETAEPEQFFSYISKLKALWQGKSVLSDAEKKFDRHLSAELDRLTLDFKATESQLLKLQRQDLMELTTEFFDTFRSQHPNEESFPMQAWGEFQSQVLARRRHLISPVDATKVAESIHRHTPPVLSAAKRRIWNLLTAPFTTETAEAAQLACARLLRIETKVSNEIGMSFRIIPPGTFWMGSSEEDEEFKSRPSYGEEEDRRAITITEPFLMGTVPVTQAQWKVVMDSNPSYTYSDNKRKYEGTLRGYFTNVEKLTSRYPIERITSQECLEFIQRLNDLYALNGWQYCLPIESEWEYACRAGTTTPFNFGPSCCTTNLNYIESSKRQKDSRIANGPTPVGHYPANAFGLHDCHGNVWELCQTLRSENSHMDYMLRGGSFSNDAGNCRSAKRKIADDKESFNVGFRIMLRLT